jgi:hypothetical protein
VLARLCWLVLLISFTFSIQAHQMSTGYLNLDLSSSQRYGIQGQLQLRWFDVDSQIKLDNNLDGQLQWQEVLSQKTQILQFIQANLSIQANQQQCVLNMTDGLRSDSHFDEGYLSIALFADCKSQSINDLVIKYTGIFAQDPEHKLIVNLTGTGSDKTGIASQVISASQQEVKIDLQSSNWFSVISSYVYQGIVHIFIGIDHILFLVVLVLTSVLVYQNGKWTAKLSNSQVITDTAWVITAFTIAHSITLSATALGWIAPSSRWVEFGIAVSIVLTALNNLWPLVTRLSWITFGFGLLHGMGFASVLGELGLSQQYTLLSILAFNLGVEAGQFVILMALLPLLFYCRGKDWYPKYGLKLGSIIIGIIAINWSIQRF